MMLKMEDLLALGLVEIKEVPDERVWCTQCQYFANRDWKGKCGSGKPVFVGLSHRCEGYKEKTAVKSSLWNEGQKPFWE
jgi:hypothetical protein